MPFMGAFWGNLPFRPDVSRASANHLLHLAERTTWRQFVLLARSGRSSDRAASTHGGAGAEIRPDNGKGSRGRQRTRRTRGTRADYSTRKDA